MLARDKVRRTRIAGNLTDRDRLILQHLPQVRVIARRIHEGLQASRDDVNLEDLVSAGALGLISAIDSLDAESVELDAVRARARVRVVRHKIRVPILDSLARQQSRLARPSGADTLNSERRRHSAHADEKLVTQRVNRSKIAQVRRDVPKALWAHALETFGSASLASDWFIAECGALQNRPPIDIVGDLGGSQEIDRILGCLDYGMIF